MNKFLFVLIIFFAAGACSKKQEGCMPVSPQAEEAKIIAYASAKGLTVQKHSSGIYYQIIDPGTGTTTLTLNSKIYITYTGLLLNGNQFDEETDFSKTGWKLGSLIEGWGIGLPLIKKGGRIKLIIPSSLAYGCNGSGEKIPPDSVLFFDISLIDVQ